MTFTPEEREILWAFESIKGYPNKDPYHRDELVLSTLCVFQKINLSSNHLKKYKELEKLINSSSLEIKLIQKINGVINEMLGSGKLEYYEERSPFPRYRSEWVSDDIVHFLSFGDKKLIRKSTSTNQVLDKERSLQLQESIRISLPDLVLSPNVEAGNSFQWREIIPTYREFTISRGRWNDIDGETYVDVQFFPYYVVLVEYGHYVHIAVVDRQYYEANSNPASFLSKPECYPLSIDKDRKVQAWEPFDGLLQDCLYYLSSYLESFQQGEEYKQEKERTQEKAHGSKILKDIDVIHKLANRYASRLMAEKFWSLNEKDIKLPSWMTILRTELRD